MDKEITDLLTALVEKMGLLRSDLKKRGDLEKYRARVDRVEQKFSSLALRIERDDPELAKQLRTAWQLPGRSLAFRNADHQKELKRQEAEPGSQPEGSKEDES